MLTFSVEREQAEERIAQLLNERRVTISRVAGVHRNLVYKIGSPVDGFAKFSRLRCGAALEREAACLLTLGGRAGAPQVIAYGPGSEQSAGVLVTRAVDGHSLDSIDIGSLGNGELTRLCRGVFAFLEDLRGSFELLTVHRGLARNLVGPYASSFSPRAEMAALWPSAATRFDLRGLPPQTTSVLHGSFSPNNLLASNSGRKVSAVGIVDFEGCRLGPSGFDEGMLWYHLLLDGFVGAAQVWAEVVRDRAGAVGLAGLIETAVWLLAFRTTRGHDVGGQYDCFRTVAERKLDGLLAGL